MPSKTLPPDHRTVHEQRVQDSLSRFLERVADPVEAKPRNVEPVSYVLQAFAKEIGRLLVDGTLWTVWQSKRHLAGALFDTEGPDAGASEIAAPHYLTVIEAGAILDQLNVDSLLITWIRRPDGAECIRVSTEGPAIMALWLIRPPGDTASPVWRFLRSYLPGLKTYFIAVRALMQTIATVEASARRTVYEGKLRQLRTEREKDFTHRLKDIDQLLADIAGEDEREISCIDLAEDLAVTLLQELMGTGWAVRQVGSLQRDRPSFPGYLSGSDGTGAPADRRFADSLKLSGVCDVLASMVSLAVERTPPGPDRAAKEVICRRLAQIIRCLRALLGLSSEPEAPPLVRGEEALGLLPVWTRVHEACRALCRTRPGSDHEYEIATDLWGPAVQETLVLLPRQLELYSAIPGIGGGPESRRRGSPSARNWLSLWFTLRVLTSIGEIPQLGDRESCALHADLAFVLREALRFACFGSRNDYFFQPSTYAAALRRLVEYHAQVMVGLPRDYNIVHLLEEIGEQDGLNRYMAAEHLQHVLEVYIAGHFVLSVKVEVASPEGAAALPAELAGQTIAEALTSGGPHKNPERARLLTQAYSLASLFHDVGHLLFPHGSSPHDSLDRGDPEIATGLQKVGDRVNEAGGEIAQSCLEALGLAYYTRDELARFRAELQGAGEPNHGLLGAWYLHRVGVDVLGRSEDIDGFRETQTEILRMAVRAVLFHGASTGQIRSDVDPVATMLIVCNEIFEWDPGRHAAPAPSSIGRSFHVMAADVPSREPRDAWIKIPSLVVRAPPETPGALEAVLRVDPKQKTWPEIHIGLQVPQRLDVPVLRLWLAKAQSLGRLVATRHGLCPTVVMRSRVDVGLLARRLTTKSLLDRVAERKTLSAVRPALRAWLALRDRFQETESGDRSEESVRLGPLEQRYLFENLLVWLRRIEEEAWNVVQSIDAEDDDPPSSRRFVR